VTSTLAQTSSSNNRPFLCRICIIPPSTYRSPAWSLYRCKEFVQVRKTLL